MDIGNKFSAQFCLLLARSAGDPEDGNDGAEMWQWRQWDILGTEVMER